MNLGKGIVVLILFCYPVTKAPPQLSRIQVTVISLHSVSMKEKIIVKEGLESYYPGEVIFKELPLTNGTVQGMLNEEVIYAKPLLDTLKKHSLPSTWSKTILLTDKKLTVSKLPFEYSMKYLVRGFAESVPGNLAIISTYKLKHEQSENAPYHKLLIKTVRHEMGHLIGLHHCNETGCLMNTGGFNNNVQFLDLDYKIGAKCQNLLDSIY